MKLIHLPSPADAHTMDLSRYINSEHVAYVTPYRVGSDSKPELGSLIALTNGVRLMTSIKTENLLGLLGLAVVELKSANDKYPIHFNTRAITHVSPRSNANEGCNVHLIAMDLRPNRDPAQIYVSIVGTSTDKVIAAINAASN